MLSCSGTTRPSNSLWAERAEAAIYLDSGSLKDCQHRWEEWLSPPPWSKRGQAHCGSKTFDKSDTVLYHLYSGDGDVSSDEW